MFHTARLSEDDAKHLLALFHDEWAAAIRAQDEPATVQAANLHAELYLAWAKAKDWARCSGPARGLMPSPVFNPQPE